MKRRSFVQSVGLSSIAAPFVLKDFNFGVISKELFKINRGAEDRVLVLIRLNGGNDGLNTLFPLDQYDQLVTQRENILIAENRLLSISPTNALHPKMTGMRNMFNDGKLSIIQNVGYPEQNRSHFRSTDIWSTGFLAAGATTGWLGRELDREFPNYPEDYPNTDYPDPFAISMGYEVSATCQGLMANFCHTVVDPLEVFDLQESENLDDGTYYGSHMEYLSNLIKQSNKYGGRVKNAATAGSTLSTKYDPNNPLAVELRNVARLISGGLNTKVYIVNINDFDTHDGQVVETNVEEGLHASLLKMLSDAIEAFQDDLELLDLDKRVAGMTFSEFGRQIASNASFGTDHGDAAPLFLFGSCVSSQIIGPNPVIGNTVVDQQGIPMQIDFRDVYASVLKDWFGTPEADILPMFEEPVNFFPVLNSCSVGLQDESIAKADVLIFPNPCSEKTTVRVQVQNELVSIRVIDLFGRQVMDVCSKKLDAGSHDISLDVSDLTTGEYMVTINKPSGNFTKRFVKVKHM